MIPPASSPGHTTSESSADEILLRRWRGGDRGALESLVDRYAQPLFRYLRYMAGNAADAEELFQETFVRVHEHREHFSGEAPFRPALYRVATNLCSDRVRYRKKHPREGDAEAVATQEGMRMRAALEALPLNLRAVFLLIRYQHLPVAEAAECLGVPLATARSRMHKAADALLEHMAEAS